MIHTNDIKEYLDCSFCNNKYLNYKSLWKHNKVKHSKELVTELLPITNILQCTLCNKLFHNKSNRYRHEKICKNIKTIKIPKDTELVIKKLEIEKINAESNKLKEEKELIKLKIKLQDCTKLDTKTFKSINKLLMTRSYNKSINSNNNIIINNNIQNNINLVGFGKEELIEKLSNKDKKQIINSGFLCLEKITEITNIGIHNEFKNIVITNLKDNFAYQYDENAGYFVVVNKNNSINELISNRVMDIEAIYDELETANKIDEKTKKIIEKFLIKIEDTGKFVDEQENITYINYKDYKIHNIKILLYNNQDKITKDISLFISNV